VALGSTVYLWSAESGEIQQLCQTSADNDDDYITSVQWGTDGKHIAVGTNGAEVQIWDAARGKQAGAYTRQHICSTDPFSSLKPAKHPTTWYKTCSR